jgi:hypothetical protein
VRPRNGSGIVGNATSLMYHAARDAPANRQLARQSGCLRPIFVSTRW